MTQTSRTQRSGNGSGAAQPANGDARPPQANGHANGHDPVPPRPRLRVSRRAMERAWEAGRQPRTAKGSLPIFDRHKWPALHPPPVSKNALEIAQDQALGGVYDWALGYNNFNISTPYSEGLAFVGYPYLSALAQRPEYRVISETIASEMTREWIELKSTGDDDKSEVIKLLEQKLKDFAVRETFRQAAEYDGFFGRGHIYIDTGDTDDLEELRTSIGTGTDTISKLKVGPKKPIVRFKAIEPVWVYPQDYGSSDPLKPTWYNPETWLVMGKPLHCTRLITLVGREVPDMLKPAYSFGGLSLSQMVEPYVNNWLRTRQSVADLIHSFSIVTLATNLTATLTPDGDDVYARADLFNITRDNRGMMLIDKEDEALTNVSTPLGTLDALQAQTQEHMAAVSRIPIVKLLGIQPAGLNASSQGEIQSFYDWIAAFQETLFRKPLTTILGFVQLVTFGKIDPEITFDFKPLWQLDEAAKTGVEQTKASIHEAYLNAGVVQVEDVRTALTSDPDSLYAGLELEPLPQQPPGMEGMGGGLEGLMGGGGPPGMPPPGGGQAGPGGPMQPPTPSPRQKPPAAPKQAGGAGGSASAGEPNPAKPYGGGSAYKSATHVDRPHVSGLRPGSKDEEIDEGPGGGRTVIPFGADAEFLGAVDRLPAPLLGQDAAEWEEEKHPRNKGGQFTSKGGEGEGGAAEEPEEAEEPPEPPREAAAAKKKVGSYSDILTSKGYEKKPSEAGTQLYEHPSGAKVTINTKNGLWTHEGPGLETKKGKLTPSLAKHFGIGEEPEGPEPVINAGVNEHGLSATLVASLKHDGFEQQEPDDPGADPGHFAGPEGVHVYLDKPSDLGAPTASTGWKVYTPQGYEGLEEGVTGKGAGGLYDAIKSATAKVQWAKAKAPTWNAPGTWSTQFNSTLKTYGYKPDETANADPSLPYAAYHHPSGSSVFVAKQAGPGGLTEWKHYGGLSGAIEHKSAGLSDLTDYLDQEVEAKGPAAAPAAELVAIPDVVMKAPGMNQENTTWQPLKDGPKSPAFRTFWGPTNDPNYSIIVANEGPLAGQWQIWKKDAGVVSSGIGQTALNQALTKNPPPGGVAPLAHPNPAMMQAIIKGGFEPLEKHGDVLTFKKPGEAVNPLTQDNVLYVNTEKSATGEGGKQDFDWVYGGLSGFGATSLKQALSGGPAHVEPPISVEQYGTVSSGTMLDSAGKSTMAAYYPLGGIKHGPGEWPKGSALLVAQPDSAAAGQWSIESDNGLVYAKGYGQASLDAAYQAFGGDNEKPSPPSAVTSPPQPQYSAILGDNADYYPLGGVKNASGEVEGGTKLLIGSGGAWAITDANSNLIAKGLGQEAMNQAFEALHPRGPGGKFAAKPGGEVVDAPAGGEVPPAPVAHPNQMVTNLLGTAGFTPTLDGGDWVVFTGKTGVTATVSKQTNSEGNWNWTLSQPGQKTQTGSGMSTLDDAIDNWPVSGPEGLMEEVTAGLAAKGFTAPSSIQTSSGSNVIYTNEAGDAVWVSKTEPGEWQYQPAGQAAIYKGGGFEPLADKIAEYGGIVDPAVPTPGGDWKFHSTVGEMNIGGLSQTANIHQLGDANLFIGQSTGDWFITKDLNTVAEGKGQQELDKALALLNAPAAEPGTLDAVESLYTPALAELGFGAPKDASTYWQYLAPDGSVAYVTKKQEEDGDHHWMYFPQGTPSGKIAGSGSGNLKSTIQAYPPKAVAAPAPAAGKGGYAGILGPLGYTKQPSAAGTAVWQHADGSKVEISTKNGTWTLSKPGAKSKSGKLTPTLAMALGIPATYPINPELAKQMGVAAKPAAQAKAEAKAQVLPTPPPAAPQKLASALPTLKLADLKTSAGAPAGLSDATAVVTDPDGKVFMVRRASSEDHVRSEHLAAALYQLAGSPTVQYRAIDNPLGVAREGMKFDHENANQLTAAELKAAQREFAVHAWLANWSASGSRIGAVAGQPLVKDLRGTLAYRFTGAAKSFGDKADEWDTLRDSSTSPDAAQVFGSMTQDQLKESAARLKGITQDQIAKVVKDAGYTGNAATNLALKLDNRRNDIIKRSLEAPKPKPQAAATSTATTATSASPIPPSKHQYKVYQDHYTWTNQYKERMEAAPSPTQAEASAIGHYSKQDYKDWNDKLRGSLGKNAGNHPQAALVSWLSRASFPEDATIKRMVSGDWAHYLMAEGAEGQATFIDFGFSSGDRWSGELTLKINIPKGAQAAAIGYWSHNPGENEIIIQAGSKYRIDSYDPVKKVMQVSLVRSGPAGKGVLHDVPPPTIAAPSTPKASLGTSIAKLKQIATSTSELAALSDTAHDAGSLITGDFSHITPEGKAAINHWVQPDGYKQMQDHLRGVKTSPAAEKEANALQSAILGHPLMEGVNAWRGVHGPLAASMNQMVTSQIFGTNGFFATTLDPKRATHYADAKGSKDLIHVEVPEGYQALYVSHNQLNPGHQVEREMLLPYGSQFRYLGKEEVSLPVYDYTGKQKGGVKTFTLHKLQLLPRAYDQIAGLKDAAD